MQQLAKWGIVPTWDLGIVVFLFIAIIFYEVSSGRSRFFLALLSTYFSFLTINFFPFWNKIGEIFKVKEIFYLKLLFFLIFIFLFIFLLSGSIVGSFFSFGKKRIGQFLQLFLFSILQAGLLISLGLYFLPEKHYNSISPVVLGFFVTDLSRFLWVFLSSLALIFLRKKGSFKEK